MQACTCPSQIAAQASGEWCLEGLLRWSMRKSDYSLRVIASFPSPRALTSLLSLASFDLPPVRGPAKAVPARVAVSASVRQVSAASSPRVIAPGLLRLACLWPDTAVLSGGIRAPPPSQPSPAARR